MIFEEEDADPHFNDDNGNYLPLEKELRSLTFSVLHSYHPGIVPIFEIMLGFDKIEFDD